MNINVTLLAQIIAFVVMIWLINRLMWGPLVKALENRRQQIAEGLSAAEKSKQDLRSAETRAEEIETGARHKSKEILAHAEKRASEMIEEAKTKAQVEGTRIRHAAQADINQQLDRAKESLRQQVSALAVLGAQKILGHEVSAEAHQDALKDLSNQL